MYNEPRTRDWVIPACISVSLFIITSMNVSSSTGWRQNLSLIGFGIASVTGIAALVNLFRYTGDFTANQLYVRRSAMSMTPDARLIESVQGVHPETLRMLLGERQRVWMMKAGMDLPDAIEPYSVLYAKPDVTEYFLWHFLRRSNHYRCMPLRDLSENSYRFDPLKKVTDREQHVQLVEYLQARHVLTMESAPNGTPLWITPWTPALVAQEFQLDWSAEDENTLPNLLETEGD